MCYQKCIIILCLFKIYTRITIPSLNEIEATYINYLLFKPLSWVKEKKYYCKSAIVFIFVMRVCLWLCFISCFEQCYVYGSVHRWSILITVQRDTTQSSLFIILQVHSTCFGCQPHPSSALHKTVTTGSGPVQLPPSNVATLEGGSCTKNITSTGGCSYSFVYSWWWAWLTPETCTVNLQNNK